MEKADFLKDPIEHINIKSFDSIAVIEPMRNMSFTAGEIARATDIFNIEKVE